MGLKQKIKNLPTFYNLLLFILNSINYFDRSFHRRFPRYRLTPYWLKRIEVVKDSPDNEKLGHVTDAGRIFSDHQLLHNGLKISLGSYYDYGNTHLLRENHGIHEPQEEVAFREVLTHIPEQGIMMELGSYWSFYSMWFAREVKNASCFMIEPDPHKMNFGKLNFRLNGLSGKFDLGYISDTTNLSSNIPFYSVDHLMQKHGIAHLNLLHSDIQGFELKMLDGCRESFSRKAIDYFFISTHSHELHHDCLQRLTDEGFLILCEADLDASYSVDGLIVAKHKDVAGPNHISISKRAGVF